VAPLLSDTHVIFLAVVISIRQNGVVELVRVLGGGGDPVTFIDVCGCVK
jgi:hypothetical protein